MRHSAILALGSLLFVLSLLGQDDTPLSISPSTGPSSGGTLVTIKGNFGFPAYGVYFDNVPAATTMRVDEHTLVAETPPHAPGVAEVVLFEYDIFLSTGLAFEFVESETNPSFERLLLPLFTPPVKGAFGSEFWTELRGANTGDREIVVTGLLEHCPFSSPMLCMPGETVVLGPGDELQPYLDFSGTPGRFIYVSLDQVNDFSTYLRVADVSRSASSFGTEIPIVRSARFRHGRFALPGVPLDPRFRNTLRLYASHPTQVRVTIGTETHLIALAGGGDAYTPAYAMFSNFPSTSGIGRTTVIIEPADPTSLQGVWGFISVTNNETQHITTITPS